MFEYLEVPVNIHIKISLQNLWTSQTQKFHLIIIISADSYKSKNDPPIYISRRRLYQKLIRTQQTSKYFYLLSQSLFFSLIPAYRLYLQISNKAFPTGCAQKLIAHREFIPLEPAGEDDGLSIFEKRPRLVRIRVISHGVAQGSWHISKLVAVQARSSEWVLAPFQQASLSFYGISRRQAAESCRSVQVRPLSALLVWGLSAAIAASASNSRTIVPRNCERSLMPFKRVNWSLLPRLSSVSFAR